jgi:hypothetical protein
LGRRSPATAVGGAEAYFFFRLEAFLFAGLLTDFFFARFAAFLFFGAFLFAALRFFDFFFAVFFAAFFFAFFFAAFFGFDFAALRFFAFFCGAGAAGVAMVIISAIIFRSPV